MDSRLAKIIAIFIPIIVALLFVIGWSVANISSNLKEIVQYQNGIEYRLVMMSERGLNVRICGHNSCVDPITIGGNGVSRVVLPVGAIPWSGK